MSSACEAAPTSERASLGKLAAPEHTKVACDRRGDRWRDIRQWQSTANEWTIRPASVHQIETRLGVQAIAERCKASELSKQVVKRNVSLPTAGYTWLRTTAT